jgi:hypothetical protein
MARGVAGPRRGIGMRQAGARQLGGSTKGMDGYNDDNASIKSSTFGFNSPSFPVCRDVASLIVRSPLDVIGLLITLWSECCGVYNHVIIYSFLV